MPLMIGSDAGELAALLRQLDADVDGALRAADAARPGCIAGEHAATRDARRAPQPC